MGTSPHEVNHLTASQQRQTRLLEWLYDYRAPQPGEMASIVDFLSGVPDEHTEDLWRGTLRTLERGGMIILAESLGFSGTSARITEEGRAKVEAERARQAAEQRPQQAGALQRAWQFIEHQKFGALIAVVSVILALAGVVIAALAYANDLSQNPKALPSPTPATPGPQPDGLPPSSPTPSNATTPAMPTTEPTSSPTVRQDTQPPVVLFQDHVSLQTGDAINLDTRATHIEHGLVSDTDGVGGFDLYVDGAASSALKAGHLNGEPQQFYKTTKGTHQDCAALIERGEAPEWDLQASWSSGRYCFLTSEGRLASVLLKGRRNGRTELDVTSWDRILSQ